MTVSATDFALVDFRVETRNRCLCYEQRDVRGLLATNVIELQHSQILLTAVHASTRQLAIGNGTQQEVTFPLIDKRRRPTTHVVRSHQIGVSDSPLPLILTAIPWMYGPPGALLLPTHLTMSRFPGALITAHLLSVDDCPAQSSPQGSACSLSSLMTGYAPSCCLRRSRQRMIS